MVDVLTHGRRPRLRANPCGSESTVRALKVCPGLGLNRHRAADEPQVIPDLLAGWGPVLEVWEGYAADDQLRFAASSGGAASALAIHCIENEQMHGVLHTAARKDVPYLNRTVLSRTRREILSATGSRYAPASPCDGLQQVEDAPHPCVFIAKPCDIAAAEMARTLRPALDRNLGLTIAIFCAGTPSTKGTLEMLKAMGITDPSSLSEVRYRGNGWPGHATARYQTPTGHAEKRLTYDESWGKILQKHRQWRCYVCPDHTGEFADIAVGDPWHREIQPGEHGRSLIVVRTQRGRRILYNAIAAGLLVAEKVDPQLLPKSQPNLLRVRGHVWMRVWICRIMGAAAPRFSGIPTFRFWLGTLNWKQKLQSVFGTVKRVYSKRLRDRLEMKPMLVGESQPTTRASNAEAAA